MVISHAVLVEGVFFGIGPTASKSIAFRKNYSGGDICLARQGAKSALFQFLVSISMRETYTCLRLRDKDLS